LFTTIRVWLLINSGAVTARVIYRRKGSGTFVSAKTSNRLHLDLYGLVEERIKRIWSSNRAHEMIFKQGVQAARLEGVDEWYSDEDKNHLIDE